MLPRYALPLALVLAVLGLTGVARAGSGERAVGGAEAAPVASLEPAATAKLWRELVARPRRSARAQQDCRPLRAVFYAATDYLRLATKLAATASPCAEYYISVPPIVADKTQPRRDAAWRIRALGPNFHAMAEFHFATWTRWVASTGSSWYTAGVTARERMAAAGYDFSKGDMWVVNEATSAVRRGTGNARANLRELLRGLYEGGEGARRVRGAVFVIGVGQQTSDVSQYQNTLQNWMSDAAFWADMNTYVSDWSQEVYGDVRNWAVPGVPEEVRRDYLNDYLQHGLALARAAPPTIEPARTYLQTSYSPLANAAWERTSGYGWTMVPVEQMAAYVSSQVHAIRYFGASTGQPQDRGGFAWAPRNLSGYSGTEYLAKTALVLDRLATAVRDSAVISDPEDPGSAACGPPGQNIACVGDLAGSRLNEAWKSFRTWTQPVLTFATPPQTVPAGTPSAAMTLALTSPTGQPVITRTDISVTLSSTSPRGTFSTTPLGPWSPTLAVTIPAGTGTSGAFYYLDTQAGAHTLTASAPGTTSGTQVVTVTPGPAVSLVVTPATATVRARATRELSAFGSDSFGNRFPVTVSWSVAPASFGTVSPRTGPTTTFTALRMVGRGSAGAVLGGEAGSLTAAAAVNVTPGRLRIASIGYQSRARVAFVGVRAVDVNGKSISRARVSVVVRRNGRLHYSARATTGAAGRVSVRVPVRRGGCFTTTITRVTAAGFVWDGRSPRNRFCRAQRKP